MNDTPGTPESPESEEGLSLTDAVKLVTQFHSRIGAPVGAKPRLLACQPEAVNRFAVKLLELSLVAAQKGAEADDQVLLRLGMDLEEFYRLVFSPTSADVHGTWASLKDSNLAVCSEPLHRFHRLPTYAEPPLYVDALQAVQSLLLRVHEMGVSVLNYPADLQLKSLLPEERSIEPA